MIILKDLEARGVKKKLRHLLKIAQYRSHSPRPGTLKAWNEMRLELGSILELLPDISASAKKDRCSGLDLLGPSPCKHDAGHLGGCQPGVRAES